MDQDHYLIVDKQFEGARPLEALLEALHSDFGLEVYTTRQRLFGRGPALLAEGPRHHLAGMALLLERHRVRHRLVLPSAPNFAPARVLGLALGDGTITFQAHQKEVVLSRGDRVVAVLADLSGAVGVRSVKRHLMRKTYLGAESTLPLDEDRLYREVLRAKPVLDLYLLAPDPTLRDAVRIFPERFNPAGLGDLATYSGIGNFERVFQAVRDLAGTLTLHLDFGMALLPGCRLKSPRENVDFLQENLASLTRFGWLMVDIERADASRRSEADGELRDTPLAAMTGFPVLEELQDAPAEPEAGLPAEDPGLPTPPFFDEPAAVPWRKLILGGAVISTLFSVSLTVRGVTWALHLLWTQGVRSGILPGTLATALIWGGFYFLRLRRQVENTPTSKVRSMAMGMVEVHGRARRQYALVSPITHNPCVHYRVRKYSKRLNGSWQLSGELNSGPVPFFLEDETGRVSIDPRGATIRPGTRQDGLATGIDAMFGAGGTVGSDEKWVEETIPEGTLLYVLGHASTRHHHRPSLRDRTIEALRDLKFNAQQLRRYDSDGDGQISQEEWEVARTAVEEEVLHQTLAEKGPTPQEERIVIGKAPARALPFVIAETESEAHLTRNYQLFTIPLFIVGGAMALWAAFQVFKLFGIR